jgi:DNA-binding transcriptional LysR family regulator
VSIPPLPSLRAFEAVARRRSFAHAASELHLTASAVSHQVARLESQLGVRLFERSAHGVRLTAEGERYLARISGALSALIAATDDLQQGVENSLYVHSTPSFASLWLVPRLKAFAQAYPEIALNLSAAHTHSDFALGKVDLDIRYGVPQWPNMQIEPLFEEIIVPLASPAFIREHRLKRPEQLGEVPLIQSNVSVVQWSDWLALYTDRRAPERFALRFDRAHMSLDAAAAGIGVALESTTIAGPLMADKRLAPVFGLDKAVRVKAHFVVYPPRHVNRRPVEAFLAWLHAQASGSAAGGPGQPANRNTAQATTAGRPGR